MAGFSGLGNQAWVPDFERVEGVPAQKLDAATLVNALAQSLGPDVGVMSNLRTVEFSALERWPRSRVCVGPSVLAGYEGEHFIGAATFAGALHLTYSKLHTCARPARTGTDREAPI